MLALLNKILTKFPVFKQFVKFCLVGLTNVIVDFSVYIALTRLIIFFRSHYLVANLISFSLAVSWSFVFNRVWTFKNKEKQIILQYFKFFLFSAVGLGLHTLILYTLVDYFDFYDILAKAIAVVLVTFWNFSANKFWTFGSS